MIPISGISYFVLTIISTVFYSSSSISCQDSILDVSPTETESSVSTQVYMSFCNIGILVFFIGSRCI